MVPAVGAPDPRTLDPRVWGPHYWFVLHTIAQSYPLRANEVTRKKYYSFIQDLPLFLPVPGIGNNFAKLLDRYPVAPYLDSRRAFTRWMHFVHNKVRLSTGAPAVEQEAAAAAYADAYRDPNTADAQTLKRNAVLAYGGVATVCVILAIALHRS